MGRTGLRVVADSLRHLPAVSGNLHSGIWFALIGWFLSSVAGASRNEMNLRETFRGVKVSDMMNADPDVGQEDLSVDEVVRERFLRRGERALPICDNGTLTGIVTLTDIKEVPQERWPSTKVAEVMTREPLHKVRPEDDLMGAMNLMSEHNIHQVLVAENGKLQGILNRAHVIRYMMGVEELGMDTEKLAPPREVDNYDDDR